MPVRLLPLRKKRAPSEVQAGQVGPVDEYPLTGTAVAWLKRFRRPSAGTQLAKLLRSRGSIARRNSTQSDLPALPGLLHSSRRHMLRVNALVPAQSGGGGAFRCTGAGTGAGGGAATTGVGGRTGMSAEGGSFGRTALVGLGAARGSVDGTNAGGGPASITASLATAGA